MYLIVGLGNPGTKYQDTRHNIGFKAIDILARRYNININKIKFKGVIGEGFIQGKKVILLKPQTYMNNSGQSLYDACNWYDIDCRNLIVIYDDIDLEVGKIRIRPKGSAGTHNGMRSIIYCMQNQDFARVRIGIGRPINDNIDLAHFVLSKFNKDELESIGESLIDACDAVEVILTEGIDTAMNRYNR
ncbi:MAG: aminoacyl-tRNA hydrolase [Clostridia bacterium]|nr:aminoacyl-tRNA hydrolase [Clostridia bacterium]